MKDLNYTLKTIDYAAQKYLDKSFAEESGLPTILLMEQAAMAVTDLVRELADEYRKTILFLAGSGNNGGDAWASARQLLSYDFKVDVFEVFPGKSLPADALQNKEAYLSLGGCILEPSQLDEKSYDFIIDGIMGTGFNLKRPLQKDLIELLVKVNSLETYKRIAIDLPTGLDSGSGACDQVVFSTDYTVTFSAVKIAMVAEPACAKCGQVILAPISMSDKWIDSKLADFQKEVKYLLPEAITLDTFQEMEIPRSPLSHKGNFGKTLLLGASPGMKGAILLSLQAAQASGVGYSYVRVPKDVLSSILESSPESLLAELPKAASSWNSLLNKVDSVALGPGAGQANWLNLALPILIKKAKNLIIDADGLNYLSKTNNWTDLFKRRVSLGMNPAVLTPHPGEFKSLAPDLADTLILDRQEAARILAERSESIVVLKGHATVIALPSGKVYLNTSGNQALAKAGSGDVLTGLAAGFAAQYNSLEQAIALAVYFHGLLADLAVEDLGIRGVLPSDLMAYAPAAYQMLGWFN